MFIERFGSPVRGWLFRIRRVVDIHDCRRLYKSGGRIGYSGAEFEDVDFQQLWSTVAGMLR
jgi:hypothetical protein